MAKRQQKHVQLELTGPGLIRPKVCFGGSLLNGNNPKCKRPLDSNQPIHLVLRAAKSVLRLPKTFAMVTRETERLAKKYGVRIYKQANVGNHLHLAIRVTKISHWSKFIRALTGTIARKIKRLGVATKGKFWSVRPYTRIVSGWRHAYQGLLDYIELNRLEADGNINRAQIRSLKHLYQLWSENAIIDLAARVDVGKPVHPRYA